MPRYPPRHLRRDGSELRVIINGMDFTNPGPRGEFAILVALPVSNAPAGTEVWSA